MPIKSWKLVFAESALKEMAKLDRQVRKRIIDFLENKVLETGNPKLFGKKLKANLAEYWSYRIGDFRVLCTIEALELELIVIRVGHRRAVYE